MDLTFTQRHAARMLDQQAQVQATVARVPAERGRTVLWTGHGQGQTTEAFGRPYRTLGQGLDAGVVPCITSTHILGERSKLHQQVRPGQGAAAQTDSRAMAPGCAWPCRDCEADLPAAPTAAGAEAASRWAAGGHQRAPCNRAVAGPGGHGQLRQPACCPVQREGAGAREFLRPSLWRTLLRIQGCGPDPRRWCPTFTSKTDQNGVDAALRAMHLEDSTECARRVCAMVVPVPRLLAGAPAAAWASSQPLRVTDRVRAQGRGSDAVMVVHHHSLATGLGDRILRLRGGWPVACGVPRHARIWAKRQRADQVQAPQGEHASPGPVRPWRCWPGTELSGAGGR